MADPMILAELRSELSASLMDSKDKFEANALDRFLQFAAFDLGRFRRRTMVGTITVEADVAEYDAPSDIIETKFPIWGAPELRDRNPWDSDHPGRLPRMTLFSAPAGAARKILLNPPPSARQIAALGTAYRFYYFAGHFIGDGVGTQTTIAPEDRGLLILRAQAEAAKDLAMRNQAKPVMMRDGLGTITNKPAALYEALLASFEKQALR